MLTKEFEILNVKCSGCENQIKTKVTGMPGVLSISIGSSLAVLEYDKEDTFKGVIELLAQMGYPINNEGNSVFKKAKSYVSCMIGRATKED